ncbi:NUDIX hydrolase [Wolbachia endosymbiont (group B) of Camptogramma bilineatum]|uniref:NUDIX hydrolase n=1 Tax=Wolbachia endosymbiont (group B) of Camptogramma bilineatum TaxID=2953991 RepID=UPI002232C2FD|nr:NUDIX domain-containing protein [Wolbachia endosymbiont (group B) of Camptogramma bilineatum]
MSNKIRFKSIVAVYLIVEQGNKTLLLLRKNTGYADGLFGLVSGHVEENESINEACVREGHEEAGIVLNSENLNLAYVLQRKEKALTILDFFFRIKKYEGAITNTEPHKCEKLEFFNVKELPKNTIPYIKYSLDRIRIGERYGEYGF